MGRQVELIMVTTVNNNKYYRMVENPDGSTWVATWGRVGATENTKVYPMSQWDKKYKEKTEKGYQDVTSYRSVTAKTNIQASELITVLMRYSKQAIADNYMVSSTEVTKAQIDKAQEILNQISFTVSNALTTSRTYTYNTANDMLKQLYTIIPRRMKNTKYHFMNQDDPETKLTDMIQTEQDSLDNMAQNVEMVAQENVQTDDTSVEQSLGLIVLPAEDVDISKIKSLMGEESNRFSRAFRVTNGNTEKHFNAQLSRSFSNFTRLLWHGSRNENWLSILSKGLLIRPTGAVFTGSMFGNGCYFANRARKSIGYTSISGSYWASGHANQAFLALYEVNTGTEFKTQTRDNWMWNCDENAIRSRRCDSIHAQAGPALRNDEHIVYNQCQSTIRYVVELR